MKQLMTIFILVSILFGCASTKSNVSKSYTASDESKLTLVLKKNEEVSIPQEQYQLIENQIKGGLSDKGLLAADELDSQHVVTVNLHSFRMREDAARLAAGIMAGCDNINSTVAITEKLTGNLMGSSTISIKECAAWGVAKQVITKYTNGVIEFLSNGIEEERL